MDSKVFRISLTAMVLLVAASSFAQEEAIDSSKPTNFYTFLENNLEYTDSPGQKVYGYRGNLTYAPSPEHLVLGELPLLYNDRTSKFGLGDLRARYFWLPYKDYDRFLGAFGPSLDVYAPTGSVEDGLGSSRWVLSPGVTVGLMAADWIQFFPILSYQYQSKPGSDLVADQTDKQGYTFQVIVPIVFNDRLFAQVTPVYQANEIEDVKKDRFVQEVTLVWTMAPKRQISFFYRGNFEDEVHVFRLGYTLFL